MILWALLFVCLAIITGILGFSGIVVAITFFSKILFFISLICFFIFIVLIIINKINKGKRKEDI
jgi:uncharacterized membrane protein YtjA (UPF0391 family)